MVAAGSEGRTPEGRALAALVAVLLAAVLAAAPARAAVPDAARESRWADEVLPQLVVGEAVWLATPSRAKVLALHARPAGVPKASVVLVHGLGVHPDYGMIGALRVALADRGFETLSVQMPVLAADAAREGYRDLYAAAGERIAAAIAWLRAHGAKRVAIVSHSLGSAMTDASRPGADGWVAVGMTVDFSAAPGMPVLDVVAERDFPEAIAASRARAKRLPADRCSGAVVVPGADHYFEAAAPALVDAVVPFLDRVAAGAC